MELLYICDLKGEWFDFIYTFSQLLPGLVAGALGQYVLCGVAVTSRHHQPTGIGTWVDSTLRVASQHSNRFGQRVGPASERSFPEVGWMVTPPTMYHKNNMHAIYNNYHLEISVK